MYRVLLSMLLLAFSTVELQAVECQMPPFNLMKKDASSAENWPFYGINNLNWRNPSDVKISRGNVDKLQAKWTFNAIGPIAGNPSIVDNVGYIGDIFGFVYAFNATTGDIIWQTLLSTPPFTNPAYQIYAPFFDAPGVALTPTVYGSRVFVLTANAFVVALDRNTGAILQYKLLQDSIYPQSGLTSVGVLEGLDQIVVGLSTFEPLQIGQTDTSSGSIISFKASDLNVELWRLKTSQNPGNPLTNGGAGVGIWGPLAYDKDLNVIFQGTGNNWNAPVTPIADSLIALNASTGAINWHIQYTNDDISGIPDPCSPTGTSGKNWDLGMAPILLTYKNDAHQKIYMAVIGSKSGMLHAVNRVTGDRLWDIVLTNPNPDGSGFGGVNTSGCSDGEIVYVPSHYSADGLPIEPFFSATQHMATGIFAIRAKDGAIMWRIDVPGMTVGPLTVANKVLYHTSYNGILRAIDTKDGKVLFDYTVTSGTTSILGGTTVHNGMVYLPTGSLDPFLPGQIIGLGLPN